MGVKKETITPGDGTTYPKKGQTVVIHYTATVASSGKQFDSSRERNCPFKFRMGNNEVIKGWEEGISKMSTGERARITCSPDLAYGRCGYPGVIPPNASLILDVELISLE